MPRIPKIRFAPPSDAHAMREAVAELAELRANWAARRLDREARASNAIAYENAIVACEY